MIFVSFFFLFKTIFETGSKHCCDGTHIIQFNMLTSLRSQMFQTKCYGDFARIKIIIIKYTCWGCCCCQWSCVMLEFEPLKTDALRFDKCVDDEVDVVDDDDDIVNAVN